MSGIDVIDAHKHSSKHRDEITRSVIVGCFHCLATYSPREIAEWWDDDTCAVCPRCGIDSVIGDASGYPVSNPAFLDQMSRHWFAGVDQSLWDADGKGIKPGGDNG